MCLQMSSERLSDAHDTTQPVGISRALIPPAGLLRLIWARQGVPWGPPPPELSPQLPFSSSSKLGFQSEPCPGGGAFVRKPHLEAQHGFPSALPSACSPPPPPPRQTLVPPASPSFSSCLLLCPLTCLFSGPFIGLPQ